MHAEGCRCFWYPLQKKHALKLRPRDTLWTAPSRDAGTAGARTEEPQKDQLKIHHAQTPRPSSEVAQYSSYSPAGEAPGSYNRLTGGSRTRPHSVQYVPVGESPLNQALWKPLKRPVKRAVKRAGGQRMESTYTSAGKFSLTEKRHVRWRQLWHLRSARLSG